MNATHAMGKTTFFCNAFETLKADVNKKTFPAAAAATTATRKTSCALVFLPGITWNASNECLKNEAAQLI